MILPSAISDPSKPVGSYENPHAFVSSGYGTTEMYDFGKKYTSTSGWNSAQHKAFYSFTGSGSSQVNPYLRTGEPPQYTSKVYLDAMIANMDAAFDAPQVKPLDDWTLVSRGTSGVGNLAFQATTQVWQTFNPWSARRYRTKHTSRPALDTRQHLPATASISPTSCRLGLGASSAAIAHL